MRTSKTKPEKPDEMTKQLAEHVAEEAEEAKIAEKKEEEKEQVEENEDERTSTPPVDLNAVYRQRMNAFLHDRGQPGDGQEKEEGEKTEVNKEEEEEAKEEEEEEDGRGEYSKVYHDLVAKERAKSDEDDDDDDDDDDDEESFYDEEVTNTSFQSFLFLVSNKIAIKFVYTADGQENRRYLLICEREVFLLRMVCGEIRQREPFDDTMSGT